jgi:superfamily II DNA or RNA helicase
MRIKDIPDFPENEIVAEAYELSDHATKETEKAYEEAKAEIEENADTNPLVVLLRARQKAELLKVDLLADMAEDLLDEDNKSVVIFTAFRETQRMLQIEFGRRFAQPVTCQILGEQSAEGRERSIQEFQHGDRRIILVMIQAGGVAISLHDEVGDRPRVALICPTYSAVEMKQALGRVHRASGKSKCLQRIIFAAGTVEEEACKAVRRKLANLDLINDGDLQTGIQWGRGGGDNR